jgi:hypothetical protein
MAALIYVLLNLGASLLGPKADLKRRCRAPPSAGCAAAQGARSGPVHEQRSPVLHPAVSLVSVGPQGRHDRPGRDHGALASCWFSPLLALKISQPERPVACATDDLVGWTVPAAMICSAETCMWAHERRHLPNGYDHIAAEKSSSKDSASNQLTARVNRRHLRRDGMWDYNTGPVAMYGPPCAARANRLDVDIFFRVHTISGMVAYESTIGPTRAPLREGEWRA